MSLKIYIGTTIPSFYHETRKDIESLYLIRFHSPKMEVLVIWMFAFGLTVLQFAGRMATKWRWKNSSQVENDGGMLYTPATHELKAVEFFRQNNFP